MQRIGNRSGLARRAALSLVVGGLAASVLALPAAANRDLTEISLEELMGLEVTSVSKKAESKNQAAAPITVITAEDIRRGGFRSVPEALRVVPGVQVARIDASRWAISIRGFNEEFASKLLVLLDGRSVYTPIFGGVVWSEQNVTLEDIERIEVIRGPGGVIWGANAVNGVINIITKSAADSQGVHAYALGGTVNQGFGARYGGEIGESTQYRFSGHVEKTQDFDQNDNYDANDEWGQLRLSWRSDTEVTERDQVSVHLDYFDIDYERGLATATPGVFDANDQNSRGGNILLKYAHAFEDGSNFSLQTYWDTVQRRSTQDEESHTFDIALQQDIPVTEALDVTVGGEFRYWDTHLDVQSALGYDPNDDQFILGSGFVQGRLELCDDMLVLIAGTKLSGNNWTGFEYQPSGRFLVNAAEGHTIWGAVSRAVQIPTLSDRNLAGDFGLVQLRGDPGTRSDELLSYELGYRFYALDWMTTELSLFWMDHDDIVDFYEVDGTVISTSNGGAQHSGVDVRGGEIEVSLVPVDWARVTLGYSLLLIDDNVPPILLGENRTQKENPRHQVVARAFFDLPAGFELDTAVFYVDGLDAIVPPGEGDNVTQYVRLDARLGYQPTDWLDLSLVLQNLTDARHYEFTDVQFNQATQVPRSGYLQATVTF